MNTTEIKSGTFEAAKVLTDELRQVEREMLGVETRLKSLREKHAKIRSSLEPLSGLLNENQLAEIGYRSIADSSKARVLDARMTDGTRRVIEKLRSQLDKIWKVEELQNFIEDSGLEVSDRYASNTLRKLHNQGLLIKVGRGLYRANDQLLAIEGLEESDYE
ncbi:hypothetical protein [Roseovarius phycicola]|uniref:Uncharacterized protein n=1 Tax=Roseovarius phycicola TaxID=3080976 RepID=A0ABZ2HFK2_9RHOB